MKITSVVFASLFAFTAVGCSAATEEGTEQTASKQTISDCFSLKVGSPEFSACVSAASGKVESDGKAAAGGAGAPEQGGDDGEFTPPWNAPVAAGPAAPAAGAESCSVKCRIYSADGKSYTSNSSGGKCLTNEGVPTGATCS